ncbi:C-X-C chemokine receptor type 3-like [Genypterus blacodes]|uniref:C-X-C chemokine receptor type 3-like n=1 Tax=Genypterus blacodes TaxID=154954 RepID=UPI003F76ED8F
MADDLQVDHGGIFLHNHSYDYDDYVPEDECGSGSSGAVVALYSLAIIIGILGNALLLGILALKRRSWSLTDTFILHLGIADGLLLGTLPFWAAQATPGGWTFETPFCKLCGALFNVNFYCGVFVLLSISLDRYMSIVHTAQIYSRRNPRLAHISCLLIWLLSLLLTIPDWIFLKARRDPPQDKTVCNHNNYMLGAHSKYDWQLASRLPYHVVGFLLPLGIFIFCYSRILLRLHSSAQDLRRQRAVKVLLAMVVVFFLCWTPYNITLMVDTFQSIYKTSRDPYDEPCGTKMALIVMPALGCLHVCLRPLLYLGLCANFRNQTLEVIRRLRGVPAESSSSLWELGVGEEVLPAQAHEKVVLNQTNTVEEDKCSCVTQE